MDTSLNNLFFLYHAIAGISNDVCLCDRKRYKSINTKSSVWPNAIYDVKSNLLTEEVGERIHTEIADFKFNPVIIVQHSEEVIATLKQCGFLLVDRWAGMSLNLISVFNGVFVPELNLSCREIQIRELHIWVKLASEELFSSELLSLDLFSRLLVSGCSFILLENNNVPIGGSMVIYDDDTAGIYMFCIKKEYRGKGYAKRMLQHTLEVIKNNGRTNVVLQSTRMGLPLYKSFGFIIKNQYNLFIKK